MNEIKNLGTENVRFDLGFLYKGIGDLELDSDIDRISFESMIFAEKHKGKLESNLYEALVEYDACGRFVEKIEGFVSLQHDLDVTSEPIKKMKARVERAIDDFLSNTAFFEIELAALDEDVLQGWYLKDDYVLKHKPYIGAVRLRKNHLLPEAVEAALARRLSYGPMLLSNFSGELEKLLPLTFNGEKATITKLQSLLKTSASVEERAEALKATNDALGGIYAEYMAQTLYGIAGGWSVEWKDRAYRTPMEPRNEENKLTNETVDMLHEVVREKCLPLVLRYGRLKAAVLGLPKLAWSDVYAPVGKSSHIIPFSEAANIVFEAYGRVSKTMQRIAERALRKGRVDAHVDEKRRRGAFNLGFLMLRDGPAAFTFLNYLGSPRDVMVYAHETGHGIHAELSMKAQGQLMWRSPIAYCETASIFGEMATFDLLKERLKSAGEKRELLTLIMRKIDDMISTVIRQVCISDFERCMHGMDARYAEWGDVRKRSSADYDALWHSVLERFYGPDGDVFTYEDTSHMWALIPHLHAYRPFYVYSYPFGHMVAQGLYAKWREMGDAFETPYLELLSAGGTKNLNELLAPFGLHPEKREFWESGIAIGLGALVEEAEMLAKELND